MDSKNEVVRYKVKWLWPQKVVELELPMVWWDCHYSNNLCTSTFKLDKFNSLVVELWKWEISVPERKEIMQCYLKKKTIYTIFLELCYAIKSLFI